LSACSKLDIDVLALLLKDRARLLGPSESIPARLQAGFEQLGKLDRDWVWVLDSGGEIRGVLLASPCHGAAIIWRFSLDPDVDNFSAGRLLRQFQRDVKKRGVLSYLTLVDLSIPMQTRLLGVIEKAGGWKVGEYTMLVGPVREDL
jgi:hypothetical protein